MHVLMALWDGGGTVPVETGIARRLVDAGHRVTVVAERSMESAVTAAGARFEPWRTAPPSAQEAIADWECRSPLTLFRRLLTRLVTGPSARYAADVRAVAAQDSYDVAVVDCVLMGALAGTESLGCRRPPRTRASTSGRRSGSHPSAWGSCRVGRGSRRRGTACCRA